jgi:hypothetical protein
MKTELYDHAKAESDVISGTHPKAEDGREPQGAVSERQRMHAALDRLLDEVYKRRSCAGDRQR